MRFEQIRFAESMPQDVWLDAYIADPLPGYVRPAVLILPGGGYVFVCAEREGEPIAHGFLARGYNAFVLHYSVARTRVHPAQLQQASLALAFIRAHADTFGIDPHRVFTVGFSAGGHLAGMLATMWHRPEAWRDIGLRFGENRPTGAALIYPVVLGDSPFAHHDSFRNLLGADAPSEASLQSVSLEKQADEHAVPLFLFHTSDDATVDVRNSLLLAAAALLLGACAGTDGDDSFTAPDRTVIGITDTAEPTGTQTGADETREVITAPDTLPGIITAENTCAMEMNEAYGFSFLIRKKCIRAES